MSCENPRPPVVIGSVKQGGYLGVHKQDFNAHASGQGFNHCADQINMNPPLGGALEAPNVQETLELIEAFMGAGGDNLFVSVGNANAPGDYNTSDAVTLKMALDLALADTHVREGGIIVIKAGTYSLTETVTLPAGITIWGENGGVTIITTTAEAPAFKILKTNSPYSLGFTNVSPITSIFNPKITKLWNLTIADNLSGTTATMKTVPMIQYNYGCALSIERCAFLGKTDASTSSSSLMAIGPNSSSTPGSQISVIDVDSCFIDGFSSGMYLAKYSSSAATLFGYFSVRNCKIRNLGNNATYKSAIRCEVTNNISITNNHIEAVNDGVSFDASNPISLTLSIAGATSSGWVDISHNTGAIGSGATEAELNNFISFTTSTCLLKSNIINNTYNQFFGGSNFQIVVGAGSSYPVGDISGLSALSTVLSYAKNKTSASATSATIYVLPGLHSIVLNGLNDGYCKIIGVPSKGSIPYVTLQTTTGANTDIFGRSKLQIGTELRNIRFVASSDSIAIEMVPTNQAVIENCVFNNVGIEFIAPISSSTFNNEAKIDNCLFTQSGTQPDQLSLFVRGEFNKVEISNTSIIGNGYALGLGMPGDSTAGYSVTKNANFVIRNCKFDSFAYGNLAALNTKITTAINATASIDEDRNRYIWAYLENEADLSIENCYINNVDIGDGYYYTTDGNFINSIHMSEFIKLECRDINIKNSTFECPYAVHSNGFVGPYIQSSVQLRPIGNINVEGSSFRGSLPMEVLGDRYDAQGALDGYNAPHLNINASKFNQYEYVSTFALDSITCLYCNLRTLTIYYDEGSTQIDRYQPYTLNITNCECSNVKTLEGSLAIYPISVVSFQAPNPGFIVGGGTVDIGASGWNINVSNNTVYSSHPYYPTTMAGVSIFNSSYNVSNYCNWHLSCNVTNNKIIIDTPMVLGADDYGTSVCLYIDSGNSTITDNVFSFINKNGSCAITETDGYDQYIGWMAIGNFNGSTQKYNSIISNNIFERNGDIPLYGICFISTGLFTNLLFNKNAFPDLINANTKSRKIYNKCVAGCELECSSNRITAWLDTPYETEFVRYKTVIYDLS